MSKNNRSAHALYVLYICLPSSAKQQRQMTKFKVLWGMRAHDGEFFILLPYLNAVSPGVVRLRCRCRRRCLVTLSRQLQRISTIGYNIVVTFKAAQYCLYSNLRVERGHTDLIPI